MTQSEIEILWDENSFLVGDSISDLERISDTSIMQKIEFENATIGLFPFS